MAWVVDTCLLIDLAIDDPKFCSGSAHLLEEKQTDGLVVCPVSVVELAPVFAGQYASVGEFLEKVNIPWPEAWTLADTQAAFAAWAKHVAEKRQGNVTKRPIADVLIGAFATRFQGLLTRNSSDFAQLFASLPIVTPPV
ncbi:MAG: type II toxin-antitoxin system VapC family toxin [Verrucomicrobia bacterium]|nr:type II toxin-antitoxin system VapC family toxin [Verrucomicrobiota bacterium]